MQQCRLFLSFLFFSLIAESPSEFLIQLKEGEEERMIHLSLSVACVLCVCFPLCCRAFSLSHLSLSGCAEGACLALES